MQDKNGTKNRGLSRRTGLTAALGLAMAGSLVAGPALAQTKTVKIGYALSKTGPNAGGATATTLGNYVLWEKDVNAKGGLALPDGSRAKVELIEYDDRSSSEELVRAIERLATQDKVDFILPPWGTGFNLAIAPLMHRFGYPQLAVSSVTDKAPEFVKRWERSFWLLGGGNDYANALVEILKKARDAGTINDTVAMVSVADGFGIDLVTAARPLLAKAGFKVPYDKVFPVATTDFATIVNEVKATGADTFVAFSYPPHTIALTRQSIVVQYNPKVFYAGVGTGLPVYLKINGQNVEGVMSLGGIDPNNKENAAYRKRHEEVTGQAPDYWGSVITYASLQMLEQAIGRVGLDKEKVSKEISTGTFETVAGKIKLEDNQLRTLWWGGQWQNGTFVGVAPENRPGASKVVIPKPAWKQ